MQRLQIEYRTVEVMPGAMRIIELEIGRIWLFGISFAAVSQLGNVRARMISIERLGPHVTHLDANVADFLPYPGNMSPFFEVGPICCERLDRFTLELLNRNNDSREVTFYLHVARDFRI